ncbi:glucose-1-phosphate cytidylyltransferase [Thiococcus pfennigii]|uniref:glucose-1-phosphate cytidylyltransferase n=1 Tax=Thiococcus pfennigii TaxID=1057 RepID=UPI0019061EB6|nr:glucose-1-phosphate cytidylyltransferase [Thiococcus pfennigii]MBK1700118.1 glucose-1-phosphate cytidylyltransferase [Thiococcus pfennigii]MBK1731882.1 glucose-1-phosphate cytidylyltransferase [Thiococcus pfennigii]
MKVAILAGGFGTRLAEETEIKPKPMVEIGGHPMLWHIMKHYAHFGFDEFVIALGYKGEHIKRWMKDYSMLNADMTVDTRTGDIRVHEQEKVGWVVDLVDTGLKTLTGGRIKRLRPWLGESTFMLTWGDGVSDVDLDALLDFHRRHGKLATLTAVRPPARYGHLGFEGEKVTAFTEKPQTAEGWINGAFFVLEPGVFDYIEGDETMFEHDPLTNLARDGQLYAYKHSSFWQCMDTLREKHILQTLWDTGTPPWKLWS